MHGKPADLPRLSASSELRVHLSEVDPDFLALLDWWLGARAGRAMPSRRDFRPENLPRLLPDLFILSERPDTGRWGFRLAGTRLTEIYGTEVTGQPVDAIFSPSLSERFHASYRDVSQNRVLEFLILRLEPESHFVARRGDSAPVYLYQRLLLPLSTDGTAIDHMIGMVRVRYPEGKIGELPHLLHDRADFSACVEVASLKR